MKTIRTNLPTLFNIHPGEGAKVAILFLYATLMVSGTFVLGRSISRALFLGALPQQAIAYRYILPPLAIMAVAAVYSRLVRRYRLRYLIMSATSLLIAGALIFRLLLETPLSHSFGLLAGLFVFTEIIVLLANSQFWAFAAEIFDQRQAKRLFGLIGAGGTLANVVGGAGLHLLASVVAPKNFIFILVLCLAGCLVCVWVLGRESTGPLPTPPRPSDQAGQKSLWQDIKALSQSSLLVTLSGMAVLLIVIATLAEYQLDLALKRTFAADDRQISAFLGNLFFWSGLAACFIQFFVTGRVLARFGLIGGLLFSPVGYGLGATAILLTGGMLWATALPRATDVAFRTTINSISTNMLYLPAPAQLRKQAKTMVQGLITPPVVILVGLVFFFLRNVEGLALWHWSIPMLGLIGLWVLLIFRARREYTHTLALNLQQSRLSLAELPLNLNDDTTAQTLIKSLGHTDELQVVSALHLLVEAPQLDWLPHLKLLLDHPSAAVRISTARALARLGSRTEADWLLALRHAPEAAVRAEAIEAYCALTKEEALFQIMPLLTEFDPAVKRVAIVNLIRYGGLDGILPAVDHLKSMLASEQAQWRLEAARALGELQIQTFYQPLIPLLNDPQPLVQLEAIRAAGLVRAPALVPYLIPKLGHPAACQAAVEALTKMDEVIEPLLAQTLADATLDQAIRLQLPRVLRRMGSPQAAAILLNHFEEPDRVVRGAIFAALTRLRNAGVPFEIRRERLQEALSLEFGYYYQVYVWRADLGGLDQASPSLLTEALTVRLNDRLDRIFFLLELLYSVQTIDQIRIALRDRNSSQRVSALELLDNMVERDLKTLLLPLIESPVEQVCHLARQRFGVPCLPWPARLASLAAYPDPWLRSCALFEIGRLGLTELAEPVLAAIEADDPLVRETAQVTSRRIGVAHQAG